MLLGDEWSRDPAPSFCYHPVPSGRTLQSSSAVVLAKLVRKNLYRVLSSSFSSSLTSLASAPFKYSNLSVWEAFPLSSCSSGRAIIKERKKKKSCEHVAVVKSCFYIGFAMLTPQHWPKAKYGTMIHISFPMHDLVQQYLMWWGC